MWNAIWIGIGGGLGSMARYWLSGLVAQRFGETFPWGTLAVNVLGSFLIGALYGWVDAGGRSYLAPGVRQFLMLGVLGGFTTFSSFSLQTLTLLRDREWLYAGANIAGSAGLCLLAVWLGWIAAQAAGGMKGG